MDDSLRRSTKSSPQLNQEDQNEHAVLRSKPVPNDFASFIMFMSSMFSESNHAVHYHSPSTVLLSPPLNSGLSFEVSRFRIPRDRDRVRINKDTVLRKGDDIVYKRPLIKLANTGRILEENILKAVILEVRILSHEPIRKHPHIVRLLGIAWDRDRHSSLMMPTLVVEYGNQGTLSEYMINAGPLSLRCRLQLALEVAEGILALHRAGVIHADIKASNVLVFGSGEAVTAKISDFGSAILVDEIPDGESVDISVYSQLWNAPEYRERIPKVALPAVDAYSFGLLFWQLIMESENPFLHHSLSSPALSIGDAASPDSIAKLQQHIQDLKLSENDMFLEKAWDALSLQSAVDLASSDVSTLLRFVMEKSLRRDWRERDLPQIRDRLIRFLHGEGHELPSDPENAIPSFHASSSQAGTETVAHLFSDEGRHISINYEELQLLNHPTRLRVFQALEYTATTDADVARRAEVCLQLAICCIIAFGTDRNPTEALRWLVESATLGHVPSQAIVKRMHDALGVRVPEKLQLDLLNWLKAGVESGSWIATEDLKQACEAGEFLTEVYLNARTRFQTVHCGVGYPLFEDDITENYTFGDDARFQEQLKSEMESNHDDSGRARLRSLNSRGDTLLHWAAITGNICVLETILLVDAGQVDVTNDFGETPLLSACRAGQFQGTLCLLGHGADASIPTTSGETALHWIVSFTSASECMEVARKLERAGANVKAIAQANRTCVRHFANGLVSGTPLHRATARNHIASVRALLTLDKPADPFSEGGPSAVAIGLARPTPIVWASAAHHEAILRLFLEKTGSRQLTCGHGMFSWGNLGTTLLSTAMVVLGGANPFDTPIMQKRDDLGEFTLLFHAVYADNVFQRMVCNGWGYEQAMKNTINLLIERGADPYRVDSFGSTALFSAVERGDCATVRHVLSNTTARRALEKTARGKDYMKPIHVAILWGRRDVFDCLLSANVNIGATWGSASSLPLHLCGCAMIPDIQIAETIIKHAPEQVHALDKVETPFATAVRHMNFDIADLLLNYGAEKDVLIGEHRMMTLLGMLLAKGSNDPTAIKYLLEFQPERMELFSPASFIVCPPLGLSALHLPVAMRAEKELPPEIAYAMQGGSIGPVMAEVLKVFSAPEQLNAQDSRRLTALHYAVLAQDVDAVANILEYVHSGLDVSPLGPLDVTPLDLAEDAKLQASDLEVKPRAKDKAQRQAAKIVELLREAGALHRRDII